MFINLWIAQGSPEDFIYTDAHLGSYVDGLEFIDVMMGLDVEDPIFIAGHVLRQFVLVN